MTTSLVWDDRASKNAFWSTWFTERPPAWAIGHDRLAGNRERFAPEPPDNPAGFGEIGDYEVLISSRSLCIGRVGLTPSIVAKAVDCDRNR
jgi:hypothetical protein